MTPRILHFLPVYIPAWQYGGPVQSVSRLCESLASCGASVQVVTTNAGIPAYSDLTQPLSTQVNGVHVTYYPVDRPGNTIYSQSLVDSIHAHLSASDVLHLSSIWQPLGLPIQRKAHRLDVPVIHSLRGALGPYSLSQKRYKKLPYFYLFEKPVLQKASLIHCTTPQEAREIERLNLRPRLSILPNSVDLTDLHYMPSVGRSWRKSQGLPLTKKLITIIGRLHHKKGLDILPEVLSSLDSSLWHLVIVGNDDDGSGQKLIQSLSSYGLSSQLTLLPTVSPEDLAPIYNASDLLLLPSRHENFGNVVVEALACGSSVLMTDTVGVSDLLHHCPGAFVSNRTVSSFTSSLDRALSQERPGAKSESFVNKHFSSQTIAQSTLSLYRSL